MAKGLFISAVGTSQGKTWLTGDLLREGREQGVAMDALKPVVSGFGTDSDAHLLLKALGRDATEETLDAVSRFRLNAPVSPDQAAAREGAELMLERITDWARQRMAGDGGCFWLVEGAGGIASPIAQDGLNIDLAERLGLPVLLISRCYLGALSHLLTAAPLVIERGLRCAVLLNTHAPENVATEETAASLRRFLPRHVPMLGTFDSSGISRECFSRIHAYAQGEQDVGSVQA